MQLLTSPCEMSEKSSVVAVQPDTDGKADENTPADVDIEDTVSPLDKLNAIIIFYHLK